MARGEPWKSAALPAVSPQGEQAKGWSAPALHVLGFLGHPVLLPRCPRAQEAAAGRLGGKAACDLGLQLASHGGACLPASCVRSDEFSNLPLDQIRGR